MSPYTSSCLPAARHTPFKPVDETTVIFVNGVGWEGDQSLHADRHQRLLDAFGEDAVFVHNRSWSKETLEMMVDAVRKSQKMVAAAGVFAGLIAMRGGGGDVKKYLLPLVQTIVGVPAPAAATALSKAVERAPGGRPITVVVHSHGAMVLNAAMSRRQEWLRAVGGRSVQYIVLGAPVRVAEAPDGGPVHQYAHPSDVIGCCLFESDVPLGAKSIPGIRMLAGVAGQVDPIAAHRLFSYLDYLRRQGLYGIDSAGAKSANRSPAGGPPAIAVTTTAAAPAAVAAFADDRTAAPASRAPGTDGDVGGVGAPVSASAAGAGLDGRWVRDEEAVT